MVFDSSSSRTFSSTALDGRSCCSQRWPRVGAQHLRRVGTRDDCRFRLSRRAWPLSSIPSATGTPRQGRAARLGVPTPGPVRRTAPELCSWLALRAICCLGVALFGIPRGAAEIGLSCFVPVGSELTGQGRRHRWAAVALHSYSCTVLPSAVPEW